MTGWIKLQRSITQNPLWKAEPFTKAQAWVDLLLHANHKESRIIIKGQYVNLNRGQQGRSEVTLSNEWGWSKGKVRRFLKTLKNESMIAQQTTQLTSVITICNYDKYQSQEEESDTPNDTADGTAGDTPNGQQTVHSKECKEVKNDKKVIKEKVEKESTSLKKSTARGTRLSPDWQPSQDDLDYIKNKRPDLDISDTVDNFRDYWISQTGQKASKIDWAATWRMWVRNDKGWQKKSPQSGKFNAISYYSQQQEEWRRRNGIRHRD